MDPLHVFASFQQIATRLELPLALPDAVIVGAMFRREQGNQHRTALQFPRSKPLVPLLPAGHEFGTEQFKDEREERALRCRCSRRAHAASSRSAPARTCRHRSRKPFTLVAFAVSSSSASAPGAQPAALATSAAWVADSAPDRNAASVSGSCSSARAVSSVRDAEPTVSPVASATQCAALRCPPVRHAPVSSTRRASSAFAAAHTRSPRPKLSKRSAAPGPPTQAGSSSRETASSVATAVRTSSNTLPPGRAIRQGKREKWLHPRTYVRLSTCTTRRQQWTSGQAVPVDDARRRRNRDGLEGLPVNDGEVFALDGARTAKEGSDVRALTALWVVGVVAVVLTIWARSIILGVFSALAIPLAVWWTIVKVRSRSDARKSRS